MVWVEGGEFEMGAVPGDADARRDELPRHRVRVDGFWIDATEVTNAQFKAFVDATGYVTTAERKPDWEEMKKQLPPGTPKPPDNVLVPASLVFVPAPAGAQDYHAWWQWVPGANWRHPNGPADSLVGKEDWPVVHVSHDDAIAYATWAGKRLPTEAQWEHAARVGASDARFTWGNDEKPQNRFRANIWQGRFPQTDTAEDGFRGVAPVKSFPPSSLGIYDLAGNVWEWTSDWYRPDTYERNAANPPAMNPVGPDNSLDPEEPTMPKRSIRGGSFLCHPSYCFSYRISARMKSSPDTGSIHTGFRCVRLP